MREQPALSGMRFPVRDEEYSARRSGYGGERWDPSPFPAYGGRRWISMLIHACMTIRLARHERCVRTLYAVGEDGSAAAPGTGSSTRGSVRRPIAWVREIGVEGEKGGCISSNPW